MTTYDRAELARRMGDEDQIERLIVQAVRDALRRHKRLGNAIAVWQDGRATWMSAPEIPEIP